jgi:hypothetical protein
VPAEHSKLKISASEYHQLSKKKTSLNVVWSSGLSRHAIGDKSSWRPSRAVFYPGKGFVCFSQDKHVVHASLPAAGGDAAPRVLPDSKVSLVDRSKTAIGFMLGKRGAHSPRTPRGTTHSQATAASTSDAELFRGYLQNHSRHHRCVVAYGLDKLFDAFWLIS